MGLLSLDAETTSRTLPYLLGLWVDPPVLARTFADLSDGVLGFRQEPPTSRAISGNLGQSRAITGASRGIFGCPWGYPWVSRQAAKIEDIPFPWPYAQVIAFLLCVFASVFPLISARHVAP